MQVRKRRYYQQLAIAARESSDSAWRHLRHLSGELRDVRAELKREKRKKQVRVYRAEFEGRSAESWAREAKYLREVWHDHHLDGWCPAQATVNELVNLLRDPHRYRKVDNWVVELAPDGYHWRCRLCGCEYAAPLGYEWAVKPCPHPGAPAPIERAA